MPEVRGVIIETFQHVIKTVTGRDPPPLSDDLVLMNSDLDSLGFAIIVSLLEQKLDFDPFTEASEAYFPRTLGDFIAFYETRRAAAT